MKVLIADDSAFMRAIIRSTLTTTDPAVEFLEAENGDVAVELYRTYHPGMVFLDIIMPVKNGLMALEEIRALDPHAKIVIVSSVGQEEMIQKAQSLQVNGFIQKPFQPEQIKQKYQELVPPP